MSDPVAAVMAEEDGLFQRAQTRETPLLSKLADLSDDEWAELTHRIIKHFQRVMADKGYVLVKADEA
jgi:hypothetical protein